MTTRVVNVKDHKPYTNWYNQPPDSSYQYIGRWTWPIQISSKWRNPFTVKKYGREKAIQKYKEEHLPGSGLLDQLHELKDKLLGCWCYPKPCHGDVLVEFVNRLHQ